jgi:hypothetical protein
MLKTRRSKQRNRKILAGAIKRTKRLGKQIEKLTGAGVKGSALP